jgi:hypothetical protein
MPGRCGLAWRRTRTGRFVFLSVEQCLLPAQTENVAEEGVGRTGEVDTRDWHTCMRGINGDRVMFW